MNSLLVAVVLAAAYPPAPPVEAKIVGAPPTISVGHIDGENLILTRTVLVTEAVPQQITVKDGDNVVTKVVYVPVQKMVEHKATHPLKDVKGFDTANKAIDADKLAERLKKATPVVVSSDGQPINEAFRKILKDDAILLIVPNAKPVDPPVKPLPPVKPALPPGAPDAPVAFKFADEPKGKEVKYETHNGYFESNKSGLKGDASYLAFAEAKTFDGVFGKARTMGPKPNYLADGAFEKKLVIATIQRGKKTVEYKVDKVTAEEGVLYVSYTTTTKESNSATFASPMIVSVDKEKYKTVVFIENGKKVGEAEIGKDK